MQLHARPLLSLVFGALIVVRFTGAAELPVKRVVLYKHGVGFFERDGVIPAGEDARLDFHNSDMNDVLKSLTVVDDQGGHVTGIRYDSNEALTQRLSRYPLQLGDQEFFSAFLDRMKGARVEFKICGSTVSGVIMGSRASDTGDDKHRTAVLEQVTLLLDNGIMAHYDLANAESLRLLDEHLQDQLRQYLQALNQSKSTEKRSLYIDQQGNKTRNLRLSYITPAAIWKSSYRLALGGLKGTGDSQLEGWAIVDNTSDDDWTNVRLSVVSGRPISFISLLDTPHYGSRQVAELPEDNAAGPVVYAGSSAVGAAGGVIGGVSTNGLGDGNGTVLGTGSGNGYGPGSGGGTGGGIYRIRSGKQFVQNQLMTPSAGLPPAAAPTTASSSVEGASGATLGELFEYDFAGPVTIKKNQSAMLPFLQQQVAARKLLIYNNTGSEHPVNAAEITNSTDKTLDGGPITIYDANAYAGEALVETLKAGDKRLIGYAVDFGTRVTTRYESGIQQVSEIHVHNGQLTMRSASLETTTYNVTNVDTKPKTLIIEQAAPEGYRVLSPKPLERTASANRFEMALAPNLSKQLVVEQEHILATVNQVNSETPDFLLSLITNKSLTSAARNQISTISKPKDQTIALKNELQTAKDQNTDLSSDQNRLRMNIDSLNRVKGQEDQVRKYSAQLSDNEAKLSLLRDKLHDLGQRKEALEAGLHHAIGSLDF